MSELRGPALFHVRGLRAGFDGKTVLSIDELFIPKAGVTVLVGENGSGKTTLLRLLGGLIEPLEGSIEHQGQDGLRARSVMVHQAPLMFRGTVLQNVGFGLRIRGVPNPERGRRAGLALTQVGLEGFERRRASALSGGEMQRVALARALALDPRVLLLDEPTANVDPDSRAVVERVIRECAAKGTAVILSTHAMDIAYRLCDTLVRLEAGRIVPVLENVLKGSVEQVDERFTRFRVAAVAAGAATGGPVILCPARQGDFKVAVLPMDELILSREPLVSSARNQLRGRVTDLHEVGGLLRVTLDCGVPLRALVTPAAAAEIGVEIGQDLVVTFKASAVRLY
jgi:tungstate transport system ATP-binding protein